MKIVTGLVLGMSLLAGSAHAQVMLIGANKVILDPGKDNAAPATIAVRAGRILAIKPGRVERGAFPEINERESVETVDLGDKTVLPGLIDLHVHLSFDPGTPYWKDAVLTDEYSTAVGVKNALLTVRAGFTTVRDVGSAADVGFALRDGIRDGLFAGPRVQASGPAISIIGGHGDVSNFRREVIEALSAKNTCTGVDECAARIREASRAGADVIKITATGGVLSQQARGLDKHFTDTEVQSIVSTAHGLGLKVAAHAHGPRGIESAARAGIDTIEHGTFADDAALKAMKANNVAYVPTLMAFTGIEERVGKGIYTPQVDAKVRQVLTQRGQALGKAVAMGITIAFGTDSGVFEHGRNGEEFALMVRYGGMTPRAALASATVTAASVMGLQDEAGTLAVGKSADIIAVDGDPLADPKALTQVRFVMTQGRVIPMP